MQPIAQYIKYSRSNFDQGYSSETIKLKSPQIISFE